LSALVSEVSSSQNAAGQVTITMTSKASASA
jgi:hypothetical protein